MLDPSRGVGTYVCTDYGMHQACCPHVHQLRAKCSVIDGVADCIFVELQDFIVNMTVVGDQIHVGCTPQHDVSVLGQLVMVLMGTILWCCVMSSIHPEDLAFVTAYNL